MRGLMDAEREWVPRLEKTGKPVYQAIADAIADDIRDGALPAGAKLPPLRVLAERLDLDFTTVSRAYGEARRRGLVVGRVGQGTFILTQTANVLTQPTGVPVPPAGPPPAFIDMTMNAPPSPDDPQLLQRMRAEMSTLAAGFTDRRLLGYGDNAGSEEDRAAGVQWLADRLPGLSAERVLVCPGAQGALLALATTFARPGDTILCEALTYPGMRSLAAHFGLQLVGVAMDADGLSPDAFRAACVRHAPKALYCNPTLHNPTTATLPAARRAEIVDIARQHGVVIFEDDAYGMLPADGPPPLAAFGPDVVYHIAGLAKCVCPALRIAYLVAPDRRQAIRVGGALRATMLAAAPVTAAVATRWISSGVAGDALAGIRAAAQHRQRLAAEILPAGSFVGAPEAFHLWLTLPEDWSRVEFTGQLRARRVLAAASDAFSALPTAPPEAVRLCLGPLSDAAETRLVLAQVADLLEQPPAMALSVV